MRDLPADREQALAAIAAGWGRTATGAHPDCICNRPMTAPVGPALDTITDPAVLEEWRTYWRAMREYNNRGGVWRAKDCPVHRP